jgi:hypothetical protein
MHGDPRFGALPHSEGGRVRDPTLQIGILSEHQSWSAGGSPLGVILTPDSVVRENLVALPYIIRNTKAEMSGVG